MRINAPATPSGPVHVLILAFCLMGSSLSSESLGQAIAPARAEPPATATATAIASEANGVASPDASLVDNPADVRMVENRVVAGNAMRDRGEVHFTSRVTSASKRTLAQLAGAQPPGNLDVLIVNQNRVAEAELVVQAAARKRSRDWIARAEIPLDPHAPAFDWSKLGVVGSVKDQERCGSCWDFAAVGVFEAMYAIRNGKENLLDLSEEHLLRCNSYNYNCCGGWWPFEDMKTRGLVAERGQSYVSGGASCPPGRVNPCPPAPPGRIYRARTWGYVAFPSGNRYPSTPADILEMKKALCDHGPLLASVRVTPAFQDYAGGLFDRDEGGPINHAVMIVGWTREGWILRNSWGTDWGVNGYMLIKHGVNQIGFGAAWVEPLIVESN